MAGLVDLVRRGEIGKGETVLFWHTGGTPALHAYAGELAGPGRAAPAGAAG
jgi:D-cysteine desulfhydrase